MVEGGLVYSWCKSGSARLSNIERTGRAAIVAYKGHAFVMVRGAARLLGETDQPYALISQMFLDKYAREETYGNDTLVELTPEHVTTDGV